MCPSRSIRGLTFHSDKEALCFSRKCWLVTCCIYFIMYLFITYVRTYLFKWVLFLTIQIMFGSPRSDLLCVQCDFAPNAPMEHTDTLPTELFLCVLQYSGSVYMCACGAVVNLIICLFFLKTCFETKKKKNHIHMHLAKSHLITD